MGFHDSLSHSYIRHAYSIASLNPLRLSREGLGAVARFRNLTALRASKGGIVVRDQATTQNEGERGD